MSELEALRAYFDAHMAMQAAIDSDKFAAAYVKANQARDRLLQMSTSADKTSTSGTESTEMSTPAPEMNCDEGRAGGLWDE